MHLTRVQNVIKNENMLIFHFANTPIHHCLNNDPLKIYPNISLEKLMSVTLLVLQDW